MSTATNQTINQWSDDDNDDEVVFVSPNLKMAETEFANYELYNKYFPPCCISILGHLYCIPASSTKPSTVGLLNMKYNPNKKTIPIITNFIIIYTMI